MKVREVDEYLHKDLSDCSEKVQSKIRKQPCTNCNKFAKESDRIDYVEGSKRIVWWHSHQCVDWVNKKGKQKGKILLNK